MYKKVKDKKSDKVDLILDGTKKQIENKQTIKTKWD